MKYGKFSAFQRCVMSDLPTSKEKVWPDRLMIRDTALHDDLGGLGQRIYTTSGQGYEKREYVRADLCSPHEPRAVAYMAVQDKEPNVAAVVHTSRKEVERLTWNWHSREIVPLYTAAPAPPPSGALTFAEFRRANVDRCLKWHPQGIESWSPSDWLTAVTGELGELASLIKMRNRERDRLPGNKFSPTQKQIADELADVLTYLDLLAEVLNVDLASAAVEKFNEVSARVGFPDRLTATPRAAGTVMINRTDAEYCVGALQGSMTFAPHNDVTWKRIRAALAKDAATPPHDAPMLSEYDQLPFDGLRITLEIYKGPTRHCSATTLPPRELENPEREAGMSVAQLVSHWAVQLLKGLPLTKNVSRDLIDYGYAPGGYMSSCLTCGETMQDVDKRCRCCKPCAEAKMRAALGE
jgi:NTP pyrophosphatase (non-canonical NTP hydrolase)